jgi:hypothetical protein
MQSISLLRRALCFTVLYQITLTTKQKLTTLLQLLDKLEKGVITQQQFEDMKASFL